MRELGQLGRSLLACVRRAPARPGDEARCDWGLPALTARPPAPPRLVPPAAAHHFGSPEAAADWHTYTLLWDARYIQVRPRPAPQLQRSAPLQPAAPPAPPPYPNHSPRHRHRLPQMFTDGRPTLTLTSSTWWSARAPEMPPRQKLAPFDQPFYLILNLAVGGRWPGTQWPDPNGMPYQMYVDFVRVYDVPDTATALRSIGAQV